MGQLKARIFPEDVTLNLGKRAKVPSSGAFSRVRMHPQYRAVSLFVAKARHAELAGAPCARHWRREEAHLGRN